MSAPLNSVFIDSLFRIGFIERNAADRRLKWFDTGVPVLNLEVDCVDKRNFAEGQLRTRLEAFIEMLASRPQAQ